MRARTEIRWTLLGTALIGAWAGQWGGPPALAQNNSLLGANRRLTSELRPVPATQPVAGLPSAPVPAVAVRGNL